MPRIRPVKVEIDMEGFMTDRTPIWCGMIEDIALFFIVLVPSEQLRNENVPYFDIYNAVILIGPINDLKLRECGETHLYHNGGGYVTIKIDCQHSSTEIIGIPPRNSGQKGIYGSHNVSMFEFDVANNALLIQEVGQKCDECGLPVSFDGICYECNPL